MTPEELADELCYEFGLEATLNPPFLEVDLTEFPLFTQNREDWIEEMAEEMGHWLQEMLNTPIWADISTNYIRLSGWEMDEPISF